MNERIQELAKQANTNELSYAYYRGEKKPENAVTLHSVDLEKFAELIVRECGQVLVDNTPVVDLVEDWDKGYDRAMNDCIHHIYEHFGVEE